MSVLRQKVYELLEKAELRPEVINQNFNFQSITPKVDFPGEVYKKLGGENDWSELVPVHPDFQVENTFLSFDASKVFNRYRLTTLSSDFYNDFEGFELNSFKRFCRNFEKECVKSAANAKDWTNKQAEFHFGKGVVPGDFYGNGSPLWKLNAFRAFLTDYYFWLNKKKLVRISAYDTLMINSNIQRLDKLLASSNPGNETYLIKFLSRKIGIPVNLLKNE